MTAFDLFIEISNSTKFDFSINQNNSLSDSGHGFNKIWRKTIINYALKPRKCNDFII